MKKNWVLWLAAVLLVCLLPGMTREASAETGEVGEIVKRICPACRNYTQVQILRHYAKGEGFQYSEIYHWTDFKCLSCGQTNMWRDDIVGKHIGGDETPTCTTGKTCSLCGGDYGKLGHDWGEWTPNGNGTHSHACKRDGCYATETENCSGDSSASCVTQGTCTTCGGAYYGTHNFAPPVDVWSGRDEPLARLQVLRRRKRSRGCAFLCGVEGGSISGIQGHLRFPGHLLQELHDLPAHRDGNV